MEDIDLHGIRIARGSIVLGIIASMTLEQLPPGE